MYPRFGNHILFIDHRSKSTYLGEGFHSLASAVALFIIIAHASLVQSISNSSMVVQSGPLALKRGDSKFVHKNLIFIFAIFLKLKVN
ncbi:hypothetical protein HOG21_04000 [bacterium]|nr:hypothetical protein [bacterium]